MPEPLLFFDLAPQHTSALKLNTFIFLVVCFSRSLQQALRRLRDLDIINFVMTDFVQQVIVAVGAKRV
jgi:hypothetical protein